METISINVYSFDELNEGAKERVLEEFRNSQFYADWIFQEATNTFKKFADLFGLKNWEIDYLEPYRNTYRFCIEDHILEMEGQRLATYLWNNYKDDLFKGKYYSKTISHDPFKYVKRHSKITLDNSCVLTGVCYDDDLLTPIYEFLDKPKDIDFRTLLNDCVYALCHSVSSECKYQYSEEAIAEHCEANELQFTESGEIY